MRLEVWSSCYCWWLRLREGLHWEVSGWHPNKNWIKTRQPKKGLKIHEGTLKHKHNHPVENNVRYLNFKIAKKHGRKLAEFIRNKYRYFFESCCFLFPRWFRERRQVNQVITSPTTGIAVKFGWHQVAIFWSFVVGSRGLRCSCFSMMGCIFSVEDSDVESSDAGLPLPSTTLMPLLALQRANTSVHRAGHSILHGSDMICRCDILLVYTRLSWMKDFQVHLPATYHGIWSCCFGGVGSIIFELRQLKHIWRTGQSWGEDSARHCQICSLFRVSFDSFVCRA